MKDHFLKSNKNLNNFLLLVFISFFWVAIFIIFRDFTFLKDDNNLDDLQRYFEAYLSNDPFAFFSVTEPGLPALFFIVNKIFSPTIFIALLLFLYFILFFLLIEQEFTTFGIVLLCVFNLNFILYSTLFIKQMISIYICFFFICSTGIRKIAVGGIGLLFHNASISLIVASILKSPGKTSISLIMFLILISLFGSSGLGYDIINTIVSISPEFLVISKINDSLLIDNGNIGSILMFRCFYVILFFYLRDISLRKFTFKSSLESRVFNLLFYSMAFALIVINIPVLPMRLGLVCLVFPYLLINFICDQNLKKYAFYASFLMVIIDWLIFFVTPYTDVRATIFNL